MQVLLHGKADKIFTPGFLRKTAILQMQNIFQETCNLQVVFVKGKIYQF